MSNKMVVEVNDDTYADLAELAERMDVSREALASGLITGVVHYMARRELPVTVIVQGKEVNLRGSRT